MKTGDTVQLKSGGPLMTVLVPAPSCGRTGVVCAAVLSDGTIIKAEFPEAALRDPSAEADAGVYSAARDFVEAVIEEAKLGRMVSSGLRRPLVTLNQAVESYAAKIQP